jgi:hypothetical protein
MVEPQWLLGKCGRQLIFFINDKEQEVRGIEISANHLKSIEGGLWNCTHNQRQQSVKKVTDGGNQRKLIEYGFEKEIKKFFFSLNLYLK